HLLAARLSRFPRSSDASCPAPNQIRLRIDPAGCRVLPELDHVPLRLRTSSSFWPELDPTYSLKPSVAEITFGLSPALQPLAPFVRQFTQLLWSSLGFGQSLCTLIGPIRLCIQGLFHRGLPGVHRVPPQLHRRCATKLAQGI